MLLNTEPLQLMITLLTISTVAFTIAAFSGNNWDGGASFVELYNRPKYAPMVKLCYVYFALGTAGIILLGMTRLFTHLLFADITESSGVSKDPGDCAKVMGRPLISWPILNGMTIVALIACFLGFTSVSVYYGSHFCPLGSAEDTKKDLKGTGNDTGCGSAFWMLVLGQMQAANAGLIFAGNYFFGRTHSS